MPVQKEKSREFLFVERNPVDGRQRVVHNVMDVILWAGYVTC